MKLDVPVPPEMESVVVYQSPDYRDPGHPLYINEWPALLRQARVSLDSRRKAYPDWIAQGRLGQEDADRDIEAWELIVADWEWVIAGEGPEPVIGAGRLQQRRDAVHLSLQRINAELRRGNRSHDVFRQAHIAMALAWHLERLEFGEPQIFTIARLNHQLRAEGRGHLEFLAG